MGPILSNAQGGNRTTDLNVPLVSAAWVTSGPEMIDGSGHHRERLSFDVTPTLNGYAVPMVGNQPAGVDDLLPQGLDSHRYRCCGNGVVSSVAEWVGYRLAEVFA